MSEFKKIYASYVIICVVISSMSMEWLRGSLFRLHLQNVFDDFIRIFLSKDTVLLIIMCLLVWYFTLLMLKIRYKSFSVPRDKNWLARLSICDVLTLILVALCLNGYIMALDCIPEENQFGRFLYGIDQTTDIVILIYGIVLAQLFEVFLIRMGRAAFMFQCLTSLAFFLAITSQVQSNVPQNMYLGQPRWSGLWVNSNTYGLLMGVGIVLVIGLTPLWIGSSSQILKRLKMAACIAVIGIMSIGLLRSCSRGAWVAFLLGAIYLAFLAARILGVRAGLKNQNEAMFMRVGGA